MPVSPAKPFAIVYSLLQHEYLGYQFACFAVEVGVEEKLNLNSQVVSTRNAFEFATALDQTDYELIKLIENYNQETTLKKYSSKKQQPADFFSKVFHAEKPDKLLVDTIRSTTEKTNQKILHLLQDKRIFETSTAGQVTWKELFIADEKATVLFHFFKNEENTHYFPTLRFKGEKLDFQYKGAYLICNDPAYMVLGETIYHFENDVDGAKLKPFLHKRFVEIPKAIEPKYYAGFIVQQIAAYDVQAHGFDIRTIQDEPKPVILLREYKRAPSLALFPDGTQEQENLEADFSLELRFEYDRFNFRYDPTNPVYVHLDNDGESYKFYKVKRKIQSERNIVLKLKNAGVNFGTGKQLLSKNKTFSWLRQCHQMIEDLGIHVKQESSDGNFYFLGKPEFKVEISEGIDWFDIKSLIRFGEFLIPFSRLRTYIIQKKTEFKLPDGSMAVIPEEWFTEYHELFVLSKIDNSGNQRLEQHHLGLVNELKEGNLAKVTLTKRLERLKNLEEMPEVELPVHFKADLRTYQKSGYNWLHFLRQYKFGGCLADDMGLGKTVQTLAFLQWLKENHNGNTHLIVLPTSLIYNWQLEANRFAPGLSVYIHIGSLRAKNTAAFAQYDVVITSYGTLRIDVDLLSSFRFDCMILDEAQAIKNPGSASYKAATQISAMQLIALSGTPVENSTMDLWALMTLLNPGLLGSQSFFREVYQIPIEKKQDRGKLRKLQALSKPFILRRKKEQVAPELPAKVEYLQYCVLTPDQKKEYETAKSFFRNNILTEIEDRGLAKSQLLIIQGLTKLRQLACHPKLVNDQYEGDSGKTDDLRFKLNEVLEEGHKVLIFSQFVKHLDIHRKWLDEQRIAYRYLDGQTKERMGEVKAFQESDVQVFLLSLKAGGVGLNLTAADYVFLLDPWWNPAIEAQAIDRAHRIGQDKPVFVYRFISQDTVEEKILELQKHKKNLADNLISVDDAFIKSLSREDIEQILN